MRVRHAPAAALVAGLLLAASVHAAQTTPAPAATDVQVDGSGVAFRMLRENISIRLAGPGVVHVRARPDGAHDQPTLVMDPHAPAPAQSGARLSVVWHKHAGTLELRDVRQHPLLTLDLAALAQGRVVLTHAPGDALYGIGGYDKGEDASAGLLRSGRQVARAGAQGHAGAPFVWSTAGYGVLVDSDGADFALHDSRIDISGLSRPTTDVYLMAGDPAQLFGELANLSGHAPLFPKWSLGFINSQWDIDEKEFRQVIATYRAKHIPLDAFTFDFDWKAWGEDWGEFRWNAKKFPDGPTGKLKADMDKLGVHMTGIMKPRVHIDTVEGRYATAHDLWLPGEKASPDYFSHQPVKDIDFDKPAARAWWFNAALKHSFDTGIVGWWNDEADTTQSNTQFLNMQRATWVGQRAHSKLRVWSINRNFWLGAQRYAYGLWSGDIDTGFKSMAAQRARMLSAIDVGEMQWGMDGGGFNGHPSPENYARWIEFGAFTPIFRVHGTFGEKRQPWVYGAVAEKAATAAIRLRYALLPYIYAYERHDHVAGVGLVRPLAFGWPHDAQVRNAVDAWMFGDWLLVSPVVEQGQAAKDIYLPTGTWTDWSSGAVHAGGQRIHYTTDRAGWSDIPLFVRQGAIIPTQEVLDHVGQKPVTTVDVDVFPAAARTHFDYYDDDGETYAYTHGEYFQQRLSTQRLGDRVEFAAGAPVGSWTPALRYYLVKIHGGAASTVQADGAALPRRADEAALRAGAAQGWATGHDRFGAVTWIKLAAGKAVTVDAGMPASATPTADAPAAPLPAWHDHLQWQGRTASMQAGGDGSFVLHAAAGNVRHIAPQPLAVHTASVLFDGLFAMAQDDLRQDSVDAIRDGAFDHGQAMPCHCFETGAKWHYVWTRDLSYAVDLGLWRFDPARSRNGLEFKLSGVRAKDVPQGLYPMQDTGSGGSWPISTDRVVWFIGARHLLDDAAFADRVRQALGDTLAQDRHYAFDAATGLYRGETSFLDWREQSYPGWTSRNVVPIAQSYALSTNVLHYQALRLAARLAGRRHDAKAATYAAQAAALKQAINAHFWRADRGLYMSYLGGGAQPMPYEAYDLLGLSLAITSGVADPARARLALAAYPTYAAGSPVIWPERADQPIYHNRAIWPFVSAYELRAARAADAPARIAHALRSLVRGAALAGSNMENFELATQQVHVDDGALSGPVVDSPRQLWSVAGYLDMVVEGVFGLTADNRIEPKLPVSLVPMLFGSAQDIGLQLADRRITLRRPATLDGNLLVAGNVVHHGDDAVVQLKAIRVADTPLRTDAPMYAAPTPAAPWVTRVGDHWHIAVDGPHMLYVDGRRHGVIAASADVPAQAALQCFSVTRVGTNGLESLPGPRVCEGPTARVGGGWPRTWTVPADGRYQVALDYRNDHGPINTGITAAVKNLTVACDDAATQTLPLVLPHSDGTQRSTRASFTARKGAHCRFALGQGFNMSYLQHFAHYTGGAGGSTGPLNAAQVDDLLIAPLPGAPSP